MTHTRTLIAVFLTGVAFRLIVFGIAAFSPLHNESGMPVSPLLVQQGIDFNFYLESAEKLLPPALTLSFSRLSTTTANRFPRC